MNGEYSSGELMAAILDLKDFTEHGFVSLRAEMDRRFDALLNTMNGRFADFEYRMNKRFDSVDLRFDAFERRLTILENR